MLTARSLGLLAAALLALALVPDSVDATLIPGGGDARKDCYAELDVHGAVATSTRRATCTDGDPACDLNPRGGTCRFRVAACLNQKDPNLPQCKPRRHKLRPRRAFERASVSRRVGLVFPENLRAAACGPPVEVDVPFRSGFSGRPVRMTVSLGKKVLDGDNVTLQCLAAFPEACQPNAAGGPSRLVQTVLASGSDLDIGVLGDAHNVRFAQQAQLDYCLFNCDDAADPRCDAQGITGDGTANGSTFGPPVPVVAGGVPVCVVNRYRNSILGATANVQTGEVTGTIELDSIIVITPPSRVCPRCVAPAGTIGAEGTCDSGPSNGQACTIEGIVSVSSDNPPVNGAVYTLSSQCLPGGLGTEQAGTLELSLPLTTRTVTMQGPLPCPGQLQDDACGGGATCGSFCTGNPPLNGGVDQTCCSYDRSRPCFPTRGGGTIRRAGASAVPQPPWDTDKQTYPKTGSARSVALFCIPPTMSSTVNEDATGLPGPGAVVLPITQTWFRE